MVTGASTLMFVWLVFKIKVLTLSQFILSLLPSGPTAQKLKQIVWSKIHNKKATAQTLKPGTYSKFPIVVPIKYIQ